MENTITTPVANNYDTAVSVIGAVFGTAHFIFQSLADITAHTEGKLVESVSKGAIKATERTQYRKDTTLIKQQEAMAKINAYKAKLDANKTPQQHEE